MAKSFFKLLALFFGTAMFLPIGCTGGVVLGTFALGWLDDLLCRALSS